MNGFASRAWRRGFDQGRVRALWSSLGGVRGAMVAALPLLIEVVSPDRVPLSLAVTVAYVLLALILARPRAIDRPLLIYAAIAVAFIAISIWRMETMSLSAEDKAYGLAKALFLIEVAIPLGVAASLLVSSLDDLRPAAVMFLLVGGTLAIATVILRDSALLGVSRYATQGNLIAVAGLIACQRWIVREARIAIPFALLAFVAVLITDSRQSVAVVAFGLVATAVYWYAADKRAPEDARAMRLWVLPVAICAAVAITIVLWLAVAKQPWIPTPTAVHNPIECSCIAGRFVNIAVHPGERNVLVESGWSQFTSHPVTGAGLGSFAGLVPDYFYPHNIELEIAGEMGLVGVLVLLAPLAYAWIRLARRGIRTRSHAAAGLIIIVLAYVVVANFSGDIASQRGLWTFGLIGLKLGWSRGEPA